VLRLEKASPGRRGWYQQSAQIPGSTIGARPNATDTMANPIKTIEAHTAKPISDEFRRSCIGTRWHKIADEYVMVISKSIPSN
jgi:hypothetical protein